ncbi:MAG: hypothetical protein ABSF34_14270 [Verrucomicrobiota bacterium]
MSQMKRLCHKYFSDARKVFFGGNVLFMSLIVLGQIGITTNNPYWQKSLVWTAQTNNYRCGVSWEPDVFPNEIDIWVLSSAKAELAYVRPPTGKPPKLELRDANGLLIQPVKGMTDDKAPQKISADELPQYDPDDGFFSGHWLGGHGVKYKYFLIGQGALPNLLITFSLDNIYHVGKEGDYTLTAFPFIYKFETNGEYLDRIDLPSVTAKIHLKPTSE